MRISNFIRSILKGKPASKPAPPSVKIFASYHQALAACSGFGYEDADLVDVVFKKTTTYRDLLSRRVAPIFTGAMTQSLNGVLLALTANNTHEVMVLDFGGACGAHYFTVRSMLQSDIKIKWHVVDTPAMAKRAKELQTDELRFFEDISTARQALGGAPDLFHSSGTIQYVPDVMKTLDEIFKIQARFILLNRLVLSTGEQPIITIQESFLGANGQGPMPEGIQDRICKYPVTYYPLGELENYFNPNYRILMKHESVNIEIVQGQKIVSLGYFAELRRYL